MKKLSQNFPQNFPMERSGIVAMLQQHKISPTRQRVEIAEFVFKQPQHLSAEAILEGVTAAGNRVSRATVYNTMGLFAREGVVKEVLIDRERVFYDSNTDVHQHIYNIDTGELVDVYDAAVELTSDVIIGDNLKIIDTSVVFKVVKK
jgi:Fur family iron response transcriptional regulator